MRTGVGAILGEKRSTAAHAWKYRRYSNRSLNHDPRQAIDAGGLILALWGRGTTRATALGGRAEPAVSAKPLGAGADRGRDCGAGVDLDRGVVMGSQIEWTDECDNCGFDWLAWDNDQFS